MERIIIYYSDGGMTQVVSETLALNFRCDICRIKDLKKRDGIMSMFSSSIDAFRESKTEIYPPTLDIDEYDTVYIGTPVWVGSPTPAIITLIDNIDLRGKDVVLFTTSNNSNEEGALEKMELKIRARGGRVVQQFNVKTKDKGAVQLRKDTERLLKTLDLELY
jgi:flavodoxin